MPDAQIDHVRASSINVLPPEILLRVLLLVLYLRPTGSGIHLGDHRWDKIGYRRPLLSESILLSHVCWYWRDIVIRLPSLWSRIDISLDKLHNASMSMRLNTCAARSTGELLDINIVIFPPQHPTRVQAPAEVQLDISTGANIVPFISAAAPRIRSLSLKSVSGINQGTLCGSLLAACFAYCIPGVLTEVSIDVSAHFESDPVIKAKVRDGHLAWEYIETLWMPVKILRLRMCYVDFTSKAYSGLSELRLTRGTSITRSDFVLVLRSSPKLRILELDAELNGEDVPHIPVHLDSLEVLVSRSVYEKQLGQILRLITPGSTELALSALDPYTEMLEFPSKFELQRFVTRSNINRFCANGFKSYSQLAEVISLIPTIQVLAVDYFKCGVVDEEVISSSNFILDALYVLHSTRYNSFKWSSVEKFVQRHGVRKLVLWKYDFRYCGLGKSGEEKVPDNLHSICPLVYIIPDEEPNPIEDWC